MGTTAQKLQAILDSKAAIKQTMLTANGITLELGDELDTWANKIVNGPYKRIYGTTVGDYEDYVKFGYGDTFIDASIAPTRQVIPITEVNMSKLQSIGIGGMMNTFCGLSMLTTVVFPTNLQTIGANGLCNTFRNTGLSGKLTIDLSNVSSFNINNNVIEGTFINTNITEADVTLPAVIPANTITVAQCLPQAFLNCHSLKTATIRGIGSITKNFITNSSKCVLGATVQHAFFGCENLETLNFPNIVQLGKDLSAGQANYLPVVLWTNYNVGLKTVNLPELVSLNGPGNASGRECIGGTVDWSGNPIDVYVPKLASISQYAFQHIKARFHFADSLMPTVSQLTGYSTMFGALSGSQLLFDL